jgi:hypothetical protein
MIHLAILDTVLSSYLSLKEAFLELSDEPKLVAGWCELIYGDFDALDEVEDCTYKVVFFIPWVLVTDY